MRFSRTVACSCRHRSLEASNASTNIVRRSNTPANGRFQRYSSHSGDRLSEELSGSYWPVAVHRSNASGRLLPVRCAFLFLNDGSNRQQLIPSSIAVTGARSRLTDFIGPQPPSPRATNPPGDPQDGEYRSTDLFGAARRSLRRLSIVFLVNGYGLAHLYRHVVGIVVAGTLVVID